MESCWVSPDLSHCQERPLQVLQDQLACGPGIRQQALHGCRAPQLCLQMPVSVVTSNCSEPCKSSVAKVNRCPTKRAGQLSGGRGGQPDSRTLPTYSDGEIDVTCTGTWGRSERPIPARSSDTLGPPGPTADLGDNTGQARPLCSVYKCKSGQRCWALS